MHHPFRVGAVYRNREGPYEVVSIEGPVMTLRYTDGEVYKGDSATQARIWENIQDESAAVRPEPDLIVRPRNKGRQGTLFAGLTEHDFLAGVSVELGFGRRTS